MVDGRPTPDVEASSTQLTAVGGDMGDNYARAARIGLWMLWFNVVLCVAKGAVGWRGGSDALVADGLNNLTDVGLSIGLVWGMRLAARPPDSEHPYGHGKIETEVARIVGVVILLTAGVITATAWRQLGVLSDRPSGLVLVVASIAIVVKEAMYRVQQRHAKNLGSRALQADALNHRSDAAATLAVLIGTISVRLGGPGWAICDDLATFVVAALMALGAMRVIWFASREMLDQQPPEHIVDAVRSAAMELAGDGVLGIEKVLGRKMGMYYVLDLHLEVDPEMTVRRSHFLGHRVQHTIVSLVPEVANVLIHIEPEPGLRDSTSESPSDEMSMSGL